MLSISSGLIPRALAAQNPEKILSLTILNTWIDIDKFKKPLPMRPFEKPVLGEAQLAATTHATWQLLFKGLGVSNTDRIPDEEIDAYVDLLKRDDGGNAFLKIMRNFEDSLNFGSYAIKRCRMYLIQCRQFGEQKILPWTMSAMIKQICLL